MSITIQSLMQQRRDTAAAWTAQNPTLLTGELGHETDTGKWKVGDGSTAWTSLAYTPWGQISYPIVTADIADSQITSAKILDGTIVDADVNASAAIAGTKIDPDFGSQAVTTTGLISADGKVSFPLGTAALPSLYPGSDVNTGIYSPGADQLAISTNGTGRLFIDSSGNVALVRLVLLLEQ